jgi:hypothetical protein
LDKETLVQLLAKSIPQSLAVEIGTEFITIRQDVATGTLGRVAPGKFVETLVQILQYLETGKFEAKPAVDEYLRNLETRGVPLDDGLRLCATRVGRAMYTLRNKRNIAHKGGVDPNNYDLRFLHAAAQWVLAELVRVVGSGSMEEAGRIVQQVQAPIGGLVEDFGDHRLVLEDLVIRDEILVLLHSHYPDAVPTGQIQSSLERRASGSVRNKLHEMWDEKLLVRSDEGYKLTQRGFAEAREIVRQCVE